MLLCLILQVPQFRPRPALHFLNLLTSFGDFTPLMASDETLASMNDDDFMKYMDEWTVRAKMSI